MAVHVMFGVLTCFLAVSRLHATSKLSDLTGHCDDGCIKPGNNWTCQSCKTGCFGRQCNHRCHRCGIEGCNRTGICHRCKPGYYGQLCDSHCPKGCKRDKHGVAVCDRLTGQCLEKCEKGYYGHKCDKSCQRHCKYSTCRQENGICKHGCKKGWKGLYCNNSCHDCLHNVCHQDGQCKHGCKPGHYGYQCERRCGNCHVTGCDRETGLCYKCPPGYYGTHCDLECSNTCSSSIEGLTHCHRQSGKCRDGCVDGTYGSHCNNKCNSKCIFSQCSHEGVCMYGCQEGWTGQQCERPTNCQENQYTVGGICRYGCIPGWTGKSCNIICPLNCQSCDQNTGKCLSCHHGHYGDACVQECSLRCKNRSCNMDGSCAFGCTDGFHGQLCTKLCHQSCLTCHQSSARCITCIEHCRLTGGTCEDMSDAQHNQHLKLQYTSASGQINIAQNYIQVTGLILAFVPIYIVKPFCGTVIIL